MGPTRPRELPRFEHRPREPGWLAEEARASSGGTTTVSYGYDLGGNRTSRVEVVDDGRGSPVTTSTSYGIGTGNVLASVDGVALAYNAKPAARTA